MSALHPVDVARLGDIARLQRAWRERTLTSDDRVGLFETVAVLLRRHAGSDAGAQQAVDALLAHADMNPNIAVPTVAALVKFAAQGTQTHEMTRAAGGQRR